MEIKAGGFFFQMLCRFLLITICVSFTKPTLIGMEIVVFRGVSRKQRENRGKKKKRELRFHSYIHLGVPPETYS